MSTFLPQPDAVGVAVVYDIRQDLDNMEERNRRNELGNETSADIAECRQRVRATGTCYNDRMWL